MFGYGHGIGLSCSVDDGRRLGFLSERVVALSVVDARRYPLYSDSALNAGLL
jgi:hypothetical protein